MDFMQFFWIAASILLAGALIITGLFGVVCAMDMMREGERKPEDAKRAHGQHGRTAC
ncbi:MAG: hypothetical protein J6M47_02660 [Clostridia bacterium]|nr:hypothetical protein [Clostridia bacterium]